MKNRDDTVYLQHICDAANRIEYYLKGASKTDFEANLLLQDGIIRQIEIKRNGSKAGGYYKGFISAEGKRKKIEWLAHSEDELRRELA